MLMGNKLAIHGGQPAVTSPLRPYNTIGEEEIAAVTAVLRTGVLSKFLGTWSADFYGGPRVQEFERAWEACFKVKHAVSVNSATSGLTAALGAIGIAPGDEVIVSPWTMSASATAILHWNAIPVFADIEPRTFCLDPASVEANITPQTKAILAVDIFGQSADVDALAAIAARHGLKLVTDAAQAPGALYNGKFAGTVTDVGVFSLNYHKHIHTGEGGVLVTNDDEIAERARLIRNHAEVVVGGKGVTDISNMVGYNLRLGEIEAAIGLEQLKKLGRFAATRQRAAERLSSALSGLDGLSVPLVRPGCTHVYYVYPLLLDLAKLGVQRSAVRDALFAEGVPVGAGYQNIHLLPMYQQKIAYGRSGFPWSSDVCKRDVSYAKGICPVAESLHEGSFLSIGLCSHEFGDEEIDQVGSAFRKVWSNLGALK